MITDPDQVVGGGKPRVTFTYEAADPGKRDRLTLEKWATGEEATFDYSGNITTSTDVLKQKRTYSIAKQADGYMHVVAASVESVPLITVPAALPANAPVTVTPSATNLTTSYKYDAEGQILEADLLNGLHQIFSYTPARNGAAGTVVDKAVSSDPGNADLVTKLEYDIVNGSAANTIKEIGRGFGSVASLFREAQSPSRERLTVEATDTGTVKGGTSLDPAMATVKKETKYSTNGQVTRTSTIDASGTETEATWNLYYPTASMLSSRGRAWKVTRGANDVRNAFVYKASGRGGEEIEVQDEVRLTKTRTITDAFDRVIRRTVTDAGGAVMTDEKFGYDASGRLIYHAYPQQGVGTVVESSSYDDVGRVIATTKTGAVVNGSTATIRAETTYDLPNRKIISTDPFVSSAAATTTTLLDGLGRPVSSERRATSGAGMVRSVMGYDIHGQVAYESDTKRIAILRQYDRLGREKASVAADGSNSENSWDEWGQLTEEIVRGPGAPLSHVRHKYTDKGRHYLTNEEISTGGTVRQTYFSVDEGAKRTSTRVTLGGSINVDYGKSLLYRTRQSVADVAGRVEAEIFGETRGDASTVTDVWSRTNYDYFGGVPRIVTQHEPRVPAEYQTITVYDGLNRPSNVQEPGGYVTETTYDEVGNVIAVKPPGMNAATTEYDSRGLAIKQTLPDGKTHQMKFDAVSALREYTDEEGKSTRYTNDAFGRTIKVEYPDGTSEETEYEDLTGAVSAQRDRTGQWLSYEYDAGGRVIAIHNVKVPTTTSAIVRYEYDAAGRLKHVKNANAGVEYADYDLLGRPHTTRSYRYDGTGLSSATPAIIDVHTQRHDWSVYGERIQWTMPVDGTSVPADDPTSPWLQTINETYDVGGNLIGQGDAFGKKLTESFGRSVGRIDYRKRFPSPTSPLETQFGYDDGSTLPSYVELPTPGTSKNSGLPLWDATLFGSSPRAGTSTRRDAARRLDMVKDLGLGDRYSRFGYDDRGRLWQSWLSVPAPIVAMPGVETISDADFRSGRDIPPVLSATEHATIGLDEARKLEPLSWTATQNDAHQIQTQTLTLDGKTSHSIAYAFSGGRRTTGGSWTYTYDEFGRLTVAENLTDRRKIAYEYNPNDRIVGRTSYVHDGSAWQVKAGTDDPLPAETTFVWDPITDRLVAIFAKGASTASGHGAHDGLLRQYLHGDQAYDDPTEIRVASSVGATPVRYYPIVDTSGSGSITGVIGADGNFIERILYGDAYGTAPRYLHGPIVDKISIQAKKNKAGDVEEVKLRVHLTETLDAATVASALRVAAVDPSSNIVQLAPAIPVKEDANTIVITLTGAAWTAFTTAANAQSVEIAVASSVRAEGWTAGVQPIPAWALKLYGGTATTTAFPVIKREPIAAIDAFIAKMALDQISTATVYAIPNLYLAASEESKTKLLTGWKSAPYIEPAAGFVFFRSRFYDPSTGNWLTPDPYGTRDSSNLYAGFGLDPVNNRDPLGMFTWDPARWGHSIHNSYEAAKKSAIGRHIWASSSNEMRMAADIGVGTVSEFLTIGEESGTRIVEEGCHDLYSCGMTGSAFVKDAANTFLFGVGIAGAADSAVTRTSEWLMPSEMFDIGLTEADAAQILDDLAPRFATPSPLAETQLPQIPAKVTPITDPRRLLAAPTTDSLIAAKYQEYYDEAASRVIARFNQGDIVVPADVSWRTALGNRIDAIATDAMACPLCMPNMTRWVISANMSTKRARSLGMMPTISVESPESAIRIRRPRRRNMNRGRAWWQRDAIEPASG